MYWEDVTYHDIPNDDALNQILKQLVTALGFRIERMFYEDVGGYEYRIVKNDG